jgi:hypothetical protein
VGGANAFHHDRGKGGRSTGRSGAIARWVHQQTPSQARTHHLFEQQPGSSRLSTLPHVGLAHRQRGSGGEADCKTVVQARCKQSGMRWSTRGAEQVLRVRCALKDESFLALWDHPRKSMNGWYKRRLRQERRAAA